MTVRTRSEPPAPARPERYGPYIVDSGAADDASRTIVITSAGRPRRYESNPAFDGTGAQPKLITRDYGFGDTPGSVTARRSGDSR